MKLLIYISIFIVCFSSQAGVIQFTKDSRQMSEVKHQKRRSQGMIIHDIEFNISKIEAQPNQSHPEFYDLKETNILFTKNLGESRLPYKSIVVAGSPSEIDVVVDEQMATISPILSAPGQAEDCRCETKDKKWIPLKKSSEALYRIDSLGSYRGKDLSRVTILAAQIDFDKKETIFYPHLRASIYAPEDLNAIYKNEKSGNYDYLIITPSDLLAGLKDFVNYKSSKGLKVKVVEFESVGTTLESLTTYFKQEYLSNNYKYALIVGTDDLIPSHKVSTSGSSQTPSDYPYFLMDSDDMIPDVQYGRVVASTVEEVYRQTKKWMNYEDRKSLQNQFLHMIGIASNEGNNPSDDEYVKGIELDLKNAFGTTSTHFYQNDVSSRPNHINDAFNKGVGYMVYLGHGSGISWASTGTNYTTSSIKEMNNANSLKPVIIDVACQNGILKKNYFGETFMNGTNANGENIGASMYYGGSVNISWHPPAIMAKGMVKKSIENRLSIIGDALLAGHIYLLENHSEIEEVRDNFEWYHLFGEPSAPIYFY